jgi:hypothetical protein
VAAWSSASLLHRSGRIFDLIASATHNLDNSFGTQYSSIYQDAEARDTSMPELAFPV